MSTPVRLNPGEARVRVQLINIGDGPTEAKLRDLDDLVAGGASVIMGQEFGDRQLLVKRFLGKYPTWRVLWETQTNSHRKTPILYNEAELTRVWWEQIVASLGGEWLGKKGAGPDRAETKRLNQARFKIRANGARFKVLNHHLTVSAFSTEGAEREARQENWLEQAVAFFKAARRTRVPVVGGGDWNATVKTDLLQRTIAQHCPDWEWDATDATMRNRTIDILGHRPHPRLRVGNRGVMETSGSRTREDHRSPWVEYIVKGRTR